MRIQSWVVAVGIAFSHHAIAKPFVPTLDPWVDVPLEVAQGVEENVEPACKKLELSPESIKNHVPDYPGMAIRRQYQGWAVFDFKIDNNGNTKFIEPINQSHAVFKKQSLKYLEKLTFTVPENWESTCAHHVYRIGYAFRINSQCTYHEFPIPIINICATGTLAILD